jgi:predicted DNA-binding transcriptional regulator YafY
MDDATMPRGPDAAALRFQRIPHIIQLLRAQPLPAEVILPRLNRHLAGGRHPRVSLRTLQHDLEWMQGHLGTDVIERVPRMALATPPTPDLHRHRWFYRIAAAEDLIPVSTELHFVTELEALALQTARAQLTAPPTPDVRISADAGPLSTALARLIHRLGLDAATTQVPDIIGVNLSAPQSYDPRHVLAFLRAIRLGEAVRMRYASLDKPVHEVDAQPIRVVLTDGEPYLWAWDAAAHRLKTYKLARVESVQIMAALTDVPPGLDTEVRGALAHAFRGVSSANQRGRVVIRFAATAVPHIRQRRFGGAQRWTDLTDGGARVAFNTHGLDAVRHWVMQFGAAAVVEKPAALAAWIHREAQEMALGYAAITGPKAAR